MGRRERNRDREGGRAGKIDKGRERDRERERERQTERERDRQTGTGERR